MPDKIIISTRRVATPCGEIVLGATGGTLCLCDWVDRKDSARIIKRLTRYLDADFKGMREIHQPHEPECPVDSEADNVIEQTIVQLNEYFSGERKKFDIPFLFAGSEFQKEVWKLLLTIPYGETVTYVEVARQLGKPESVRAVANAIGANALSILVPCHRVIGASGNLTGYAGGLNAKEYLLKLEGSRKL